MILRASVNFISGVYSSTGVHHPYPHVFMPLRSFLLVVILHKGICPQHRANIVYYVFLMFAGDKHQLVCVLRLLGEMVGGHSAIWTWI